MLLAFRFRQRISTRPSPQFLRGSPWVACRHARLDSEVVYARKAVSRRAWAVPFVLLAAFTLAMVVKDLPDFRTSTVVASMDGFSPALAVWLLTLWSINRYGAITLTRQTLRAGSARRRATARACSPDC